MGNEQEIIQSSSSVFRALDSVSSFRQMLATDISGRDLPRMLTNSYCGAENWFPAVIYAFEFRRDKEGIS